MAEGHDSDAKLEPEASQSDTWGAARVHELVRQLAEIEAELARVSQMGGIDSVIDPATSTPILLRQAQADLAASEERYDRLVKAMSAIVFEATPGGGVTFTNDALTPITGYPPQELRGERAWEILVPGALRKQMEELASHLRCGNVVGYELTVTARDGSRILLELNTANQYGPDGRLERVVGIATDISKRKQAEDALRTSQARLRAYSRRLVEAIENERRSLARELHDQAAQSMSALKLILSNLRNEVGHDERHGARFEEIGAIVDDVMDDLHRLAVNLRPASLDRNGLLRAVEQYVESYQKQSGLKVDLVSVGFEERRLATEIETMIYRVVQEALTNVVRHAGANRVSVLLECNGEQVVAIVEDDGRGFDANDAASLGRLGIMGMRERAEVLGGSFTIESAAGKGTTVYVAVPLSVG